MLLARELADLALSLTEGLSGENRFENMVQSLRQLLSCDAASLLMYQGAQFIPLAISGLSPDVMGRRFDIDEHPRLQAIARAGDVVRFPDESDLPDPFDGLIPNHAGRLHVHACIGLPLVAGERLIGALTIDAFDPSLSERFSDDALRTISSLVAASLQNALLLERLEQRGHDDHATMPVPALGPASEIIGESPAMMALKTSIEVVADTDLNVLIQGDTGVGKELVARAIHEGSPRNNRPLVYLNCAALPESVAESELFGHVKGAFTGAISNRQGKFELADNGTLFLDEIGELPLGLQAKLLRVIQYGDLQRVGDDTPLKVNVRVIAATNRDLNAEVSEGRFRADLYHRLSVFPLFVPPLSQRADDVVLLAGYFTERTRAKLHLTQLQISPDAIAALTAYNWPGNVRELEHTIYRAAVLARSQTDGSIVQIQTIHLGKITGHVSEYTVSLPEAGIRVSRANLPSELVAMPLREATDAFQKFRIENTLAANQNNWSAAARELGIDAGNLHRLAKRLGLK